MIIRTLIVILSACLMAASGCRSNDGHHDQSEDDDNHSLISHLPSKTAFDTMVDSQKVELFYLTNKEIGIAVTNYGARIVSWMVKDNKNVYTDIVLGYESIKDYLKDPMYLGCAVGRYANRIAGGKFYLEGNEYNLAINNAPNTLHGGIKGFDKVVWDAVQNGNKITMKYYSRDMEEGYPGNLEVTIIYELTDRNELVIDYFATSDKNTIVNLTNHSYFNLSGSGSTSVLGHILFIDGDRITPIDSTLIPTGDYMDVINTPFDFRGDGKTIGNQIDEDHTQLVYGFGYDHNWVLNKEGDELTLAASLSEQQKGIRLEIYTTAPGIQFYSGNFMDGSVIGKKGQPYNYRSAVALEPQYYPDSPNKPNFPSPILKVGDKYFHRCIYKIKSPI